VSVLILGSSLRGLDAVARTLVSRGEDVLLFDSEHPGAPEGLEGRVTVLPSEWHRSFVEGVDRIVTSPWFAENKPPIADALAEGVPVLTEAGFGLEAVTAPVVAVTGTNGKTTVTLAVADMLAKSGVRAVAAGNVGSPVSSLDHDSYDVAVLELSSYQLRFIGRLAPAAATVLNIAPDHLDWHGSMEAYTAAKASIVEGAPESAVFAYNVDDPRVVEIASGAPCVTVPCSGTHVPPGGNGVEGDDLVVGDLRFGLPITDPSFRLDLCIAATLALAVGASEEGVRLALDGFTLGRHRREHVGTAHGVSFVNDSKATNPHAAVAAALAYPSVVLLAGGENKDLDLSPLVSIPTVRAIVAFGETGPEIAALAGDGAVQTDTLESAFDLAVAIAVEGDTVLLAPGCASFDQFVNYMARGDLFRSLAEAHIEEAA